MAFHILRCGAVSGQRKIFEVDEELVDILRLNNELGQIHQHITGKQRCLATTQAEITLTELGINESELWQWYFQVNLNSTPPKDVAAFAKHNGFSDVSQLQQAVLAEYHYVTQTQAQATQ